MRLRNIKGSVETVNAHEIVNTEPKLCKGKWNEFFGNDNPIYIEIGMGKGDFIFGNAKKNPDINYIGIEKYSGVLLRAVRKLDRMEIKPDNICFLRLDAHEITEVFEENEVSKVFLNFSDPWPKDRHAKHRLTHRNFLNKYKGILENKAFLQFKSDNDSLYAFSLEEVKETTYKMIATTTDLHQSEYVEGNIMTEYESKFVADGKNISYLLIQNQK